jgi:hypothetical protein
VPRACERASCEACANLIEGHGYAIITQARVQAVRCLLLSSSELSTGVTICHVIGAVSNHSVPLRTQTLADALQAGIPVLTKTAYRRAKLTTFAQELSHQRHPGRHTSTSFVPHTHPTCKFNVKLSSAHIASLPAQHIHATTADTCDLEA